jgi:diguanylate cyclase (GGDEF)-like protein
MAHKILIVEDSHTLAKYLVRKLEAAIGHIHIDVVGTYAELKVLLEEKCDYTIALLDVYLPDMNDTELIEYVLSKNIPSVVMTGSFDEKVYEKLTDNNIVDLVLKDSPQAMEYIVYMVDRLLRNTTTTVMVVDDSPTVLHQINRYLKNQLYRVMLEKNPSEALIKLLAHEEISIVVSDYYMPGIDGVEFLQKIRRLRQKDNLGFIGISSDAMSATKFLKFGANDFINKPFNKDEFCHRVNNLAQNIENIQTLKDYANRDFLTKVYNRKYFFEEGEHYFQKALKEQNSFAVAMIDIDNFKGVNDTYGHDIGDKVIKVLARKLIEKTKGQDLVARFGGEEFCVLLKDIPPLLAERFFNELCREIAALSVEADIGDHIGFTVSIGVETKPLDTLEEMIKQADINLYEAKESGKNKVVTHIMEEAF